MYGEVFRPFRTIYRKLKEMSQRTGLASERAEIFQLSADFLLVIQN